MLYNVKIHSSNNMNFKKMRDIRLTNLHLNNMNFKKMLAKDKKI